MLPDRRTILLFLKGMAMGAADSVPGVSGGTIALITNIYEELIDAIRSVDLQALVILRREGLKAAWRHVNGNFLVTLLAGILSSLLLLGHLILVLMDNYLPYLLAFFGGLVLASIRYVGKGVGGWTAKHMALLLTGALFALALAFLPLRENSGGLLFYFFSGAIAICAMILPGISGAFILVLLGAYGPVLEALTGFDLPIVTVFAAGCACGLLAFSRVLSWLLHHHHAATLAALTGMLTGSLYLLWPWRVATELTLDSHAFTRYEHVLPGTYLQATGQSCSPLICLGLLVAGAVLVLLLESLAGNNNKENSAST